MDKMLGVEVWSKTLKHKVEHNGSIHNIGCDRFYVHYWLAIYGHIIK